MSVSLWRTTDPSRMHDTFQERLKLPVTLLLFKNTGSFYESIQDTKYSNGAAYKIAYDYN